MIVQRQRRLVRRADGSFGVLPFIDMFLQYANKESTVTIPSQMNVTPADMSILPDISPGTIIGLSVGGLAVIGLIALIIARKA